MTRLSRGDRPPRGPIVLVGFAVGNKSREWLAYGGFAIAKTRAAVICARVLMRYDQRTIRWALAAALLLLALAALATHRAFRAHLHASELTAHTFVMLNRTRQLLLDLVDAETGERGFLLTGNDAFLQPFNAARPKIPRLIAELKDLTADNPHHRPRLDALEKKAGEKLALIERLVAMRRARGSEAAVPASLVDTGEKIMDEIRLLIAEMEREEEGLLVARDAALVRSTQQAIFFILLGDTAGLGLLFAAGYVTNREMRARAQSEAKLAETVRELSASNRELEQFAYVASHDLQEPLRMVANYCQLLKRRYHSRLDGDADEFIGFAVDGAQRMQVLIDDLLAYSRIGTRGEKLAPIDAEAVLQATLRNLAAALAESGGVIAHDPLPVVIADASTASPVVPKPAWQRAKISRCGGAAHPRLGRDTRRRLALRRARQWHRHRAGISRADFPHLPAATLQGRIPRYWHRVGDLQKNRRTAQWHHLGAIHPGRWGHFLFYNATKNALDRRRFHVKVMPIEILLVEDNPGDVRLTREALKDAKIVNNVTVARDGVEALAIVRKEGEHASALTPDLILLDLNLPKVHGLEVLARLKNTDGLKRIPIVILTSSKAKADIVKAYDLHANCFITKPLDLQQFIDVARSIENFWFTVVQLPPKP